MDNDLQIIPSFKNSLFNDNVKGIISGFAEIGIDSVMSDGLLKDIPIVNTLVAFGKFGANIRDRNLLKQTLVFIETFNNQTIDPFKLNAYREKINNNTKKTEAELGRVIILLNSNIDDAKSQMLAKCYVAYVNDKITWEQFVEFSDCISRLFISDIELLFEIYYRKIQDTKQCDLHKAERLSSIGLVNMSLLEVYSTISHKYLNISTLGKEFCKTIKGI